MIAICERHPRAGKPAARRQGAVEDLARSAHGGPAKRTELGRRKLTFA
jgi:hypothetical protein